MPKLLLFIILLFNFTFASTLESLLEEYETTSKDSLQTLNDKMGHARIYSQKELKTMQYDKLSDVLRELPITSLNRSSFGPNTLSLTGTKSEASGFFRLFINDHEVSSAYTQSPFLIWYELPVSLIDYIEIYYGEGSFTLGNTTGVEFIRVYTKKATKENGGSFKSVVSNKSTNSQEVSYSTVLENGWSYLAYFANQNNFFQRSHNNKSLNADNTQQYLFLDIADNNNSINVAYTRTKKEDYQGMSFDGNTDDGDIKVDDFYITYSRYFSKDKSLKLNLSLDVQNRKNREENSEGIAIVGANYPITLTKKYEEDIKLTKTSASLSKKFTTKNNNLFTALNVKNIEYKTRSRSINDTINIGKFNDFNRETSYSFALQDDYKLLDNLIVIGNYKVDKYVRNGFMDDSVETLYRVGSIFLPTENLGFKSFYTVSHVPPSFYNADFSANSQENLDSQKYKYFTFESAYTYNDSRVSLEYFNVHIDDYIYYVNPQYIPPFHSYIPIGFINVDHTIKINGFIFDYLYNIDRNSKFELNYFSSQLSEVKSNYTHGGYIKYMKNYDKFSYFASLIYKKGFDYLDLNIEDSYNLNLGATYNFTKNFSLSLKGTNLLNKSTQSILTDSSTSSSADLSLIDDYDRTVSISLNWRF